MHQKNKNRPTSDNRKMIIPVINNLKTGINISSSYNNNNNVHDVNSDASYCNFNYSKNSNCTKNNFTIHVLYYWMAKIQASSLFFQ